MVYFLPAWRRMEMKWYEEMLEDVRGRLDNIRVISLEAVKHRAQVNVLKMEFQ